MTLYGILIAYVFIGCVYWLWMFVGTVRVVRSVPLLAQSDSPPPQTWPKLSIVIPACNEAASLESALRSVLEQDYPELEIILIDDRSTDGTAAIVDRMAAGRSADPRDSRRTTPRGLAGQGSCPGPGHGEGQRFVAAVHRCRRPHGPRHAPPRDGLRRAPLRSTIWPPCPISGRARCWSMPSWRCFAARSWSPCGCGPSPIRNPTPSSASGPSISSAAKHSSAPRDFPGCGWKWATTRAWA